jgi:hypothetical protein
MSISNAEIDAGLWFAWKMGLPLQVNGQSIAVDDDIGQAVQARLGPAGEPMDLAALDLEDDAMGRIRLAMWTALAMARAAHALAEIGAKTGLLPSPAAA